MVGFRYENFALFNYITIFHLFSLSAIALDIEGGSGFGKR